MSSCLTYEDLANIYTEIKASLSSHCYCCHCCIFFIYNSWHVTVITAVFFLSITADVSQLLSSLSLSFFISFSLSLLWAGNKVLLKSHQSVSQQGELITSMTCHWGEDLFTDWLTERTQSELLIPSDRKNCLELTALTALRTSYHWDD